MTTQYHDKIINMRSPIEKDSNVSYVQGFCHARQAAAKIAADADKRIHLLEAAQESWLELAEQWSYKMKLLKETIEHINQLKDQETNKIVDALLKLKDDP